MDRRARPRAFDVVLASAITVASGCPAAAVPAPTCTRSSDCASGLVCVEARCVPRPVDGGLDVGCASGGCECEESAECASPAPCIDAVCVLGACREFAYDSRCASGEYCDAVRGCVLVPDAGSFDAPPPDVPPLDAGIRRRDAGLLPVGDRCILDRECAPVTAFAPECIDAPSELAPGVPAPPDGYCSARCMPFVPGGCGMDAVCVETDPLAGTAWCLRTCTSGSDCRSGQTCAVPAFGGLGAVPVCLPPL